jgi:hypothetical protein
MVGWLFYPTNCGFRNEALNLKTEDVIIFCLIRLSPRPGRHDELLWSNDRLIIGVGKPKKPSENPVPVPFYPS